jgi:parallel beta-helix repeat protein
VHGTHLSTVEENVLYNVRGAGIYLEDGNEMFNKVKYNVRRKYWRPPFYLVFVP